MHCNPISQSYSLAAVCIVGAMTKYVSLDVSTPFVRMRLDLISVLESPLYEM